MGAWTGLFIPIQMSDCVSMAQGETFLSLGGCGLGPCVPHFLVHWYRRWNPSNGAAILWRLVPKPWWRLRGNTWLGRNSLKPKRRWGARNTYKPSEYCQKTWGLLWFLVSNVSVVHKRLVGQVNSHCNRIKFGMLTLAGSGGWAEAVGIRRTDGHLTMYHKWWVGTICKKIVGLMTWYQTHALYNNVWISLSFSFILMSWFGHPDCVQWCVFVCLHYMAIGFLIHFVKMINFPSVCSWLRLLRHHVIRCRILFLLPGCNSWPLNMGLIHSKCSRSPRAHITRSCFKWLQLNFLLCGLMLHVAKLVVIVLSPPSCPHWPIDVEIWVPSIVLAQATEAELADIHGPKRGAPLSTQTTPVKSSVLTKKARTDQVGAWSSCIFIILFIYIYIYTVLYPCVLYIYM